MELNITNTFSSLKHRWYYRFCVSASESEIKGLLPDTFSLRWILLQAEVILEIRVPLDFHSLLLLNINQTVNTFALGPCPPLWGWKCIWCLFLCWPSVHIYLSKMYISESVLSGGWISEVSSVTLWYVVVWNREWETRLLACNCMSTCDCQQARHTSTLR